jgi:adenylate cyclase
MSEDITSGAHAPAESFDAPLPPVPPPSRPDVERAADDPARGVSTGQSPVRDIGPGTLSRTAQLPVVPRLAPDASARPLSATEAATLAQPTVPGAGSAAVPEDAPITTSMPVVPIKHQDEADVRNAARELERRLLGGERTLRRREVASDVGVSLLSARKIWRSLGLPRVGDDEVAYTSNDEAALETIIDQVREHLLTEEAALSITRSLGQLTDRMVIWQIEAIVEDLVQNQGMSDAEARRQVILLLDDLIDPIEEVMIYAYRRNLAAAVQRQVVRAESGLKASNEHRDGSEDDAALPLARAVGFADMVSFTKLSRRMDERTLAKLVQGFEARCSEIITVGGGRLVKTIGDEVLYVAETPQAGARIALTLAGEFGVEDVAGRETPRVRVGLVWGRVLSRLGDIYGATVNMAARLTSMAEPQQVLTDHLTAQVLAGDARFVLTEQESVHLHGFGEVTPYALTEGQGATLPLD